MSAYRAGRDVEHRNREHLEAEGYEVTRAAGSKGKADLIAYKPGQLLFVQCKLLAAPLTGRDWDHLRKIAGWVGAYPLLGTRSTVEGCQEFHGSQKCGTVLWHLTGPYVPRAAAGVQPKVPFRTDLLVEDPGRGAA